MPDRMVSWLKRWVSRNTPPATLDELVNREFGLRIRQQSHYEEALTHASMLDGDATGLRSNERLEFLGDCALDLAVATFLFDMFPEDQEGALTQRKSKIVNRKTLNLLGERMGLPTFIRAKMRRQDIQDAVVGNALEALIGAIYLDHGFKKTEKAVLRMLKRHGADEKVHQTLDFKSKLFQWTQGSRRSLEFQVLSESSADGESIYQMAVRVDGEVFGKAEGRSKKEAEQAASRVAWKTAFDRGLIDEKGTAIQAPMEPVIAPKPQGRSRGPRGKGSRQKAALKKESQPAESPAEKGKDSSQRKSVHTPSLKGTAGAELPAGPLPEPRRRMKRKSADSND